MKVEPYGYPIDCGYKGLVEEPDKYMIFETEGAYKEYLEEDDAEQQKR